MKHKHLGNVHIKYRHGADRYDAVVTSPEIDPIARTLHFRKLDGIYISFPLEAILFWQYGRVDQLEKPEPEPTDVVYQHPFEDWPADTKGY
jgi:hypothetical protein